MFPYNLLILPLAGGYFILSNLLWFKYKYQRFDTSRLILNSIIAGVIISICSFIVRVLFKIWFPAQYFNVCKLLNKLPFKRTEDNRYLWTLMFGFIAVIILVYLINGVILFIWKYHGVISKALDKHGDELEQLFRDSVNQALPVQITLKNEKVYLGLVEKIPEPKKTNYIVLITLYSGYRQKDTKEMVLTTSYAPINELIESGEIAPKTDKFRVIIKQDEILTAQPHDAVLYTQFIKTKSESENKRKKVDESCIGGKEESY